MAIKPERSDFESRLRSVKPTTFDNRDKLRNVDKLDIFKMFYRSNKEHSLKHFPFY